MPATIEALTRVGRRIVSADHSDSHLTTLARWALDNSPYRPMSRLDCRVTDGVMVLSGVVPTYYLKQLAQEVLRRLDVDTRIDNRVEVAS